MISDGRKGASRADLVKRLVQVLEARHATAFNRPSYTQRVEIHTKTLPPGGPRPGRTQRCLAQPTNGELSDLQAKVFLILEGGCTSALQVVPSPHCCLQAAVGLRILVVFFSFFFFLLPLRFCTFQRHNAQAKK